VQASCGLLTGKVSNVDLAGDGGGDEGGAAFLEKFDGSFGFLTQGVKLHRYSSMWSHFVCCSSVSGKATRTFLNLSQYV